MRHIRVNGQTQYTADVSPGHLFTIAVKGGATFLAMGEQDGTLTILPHRADCPAQILVDKRLVDGFRGLNLTYSG